MNRKILHVGYRHLCTCIATLAIIQFSYICTIVHVVSLKISSMKTKPALLVNWPEETVAYLMLFVLVHHYTRSKQSLLNSDYDAISQRPFVFLPLLNTLVQRKAIDAKLSSLNGTIPLPRQSDAFSFERFVS